MPAFAYPLLRPYTGSFIRISLLMLVGSDIGDALVDIIMAAVI
jgi:hypothetical protein